MAFWTGRFKATVGGFDRRIYILSFGWLVMSAGFAMVIPFLSIYFNQELGISMSVIGLFFGFSAILRAVPQPFAGWLSDRIGRVPIMAWSQILRAFTFVGVGYAIMHRAGFLVIAGIVSLNYIFGSVLGPAANAMVAEVVERKRRISAFATLRIAGNLGWAIGPALGGFIAQKSYGALFYVAAGIAFFSGIYFLVGLKDLPRTARADRTDLKIKDIFNIRQDRLLFEYCLVSFVLFLVVAQLVAALSVYSVGTVGISQSQLGALYTLNGLMVVFLQFPISARLGRFTLTSQLAAGALIYAVGYFLVGLAPGFEFLVFCMIVITTAEMVVSPPSLTIVANLSSPATYGRYMGVFEFFHMAGWSLGPTVGGILLDLLAPWPIFTWLTISLLGLASFALYLNFGRKLPPMVNAGSKGGEE